MKRWLVAALAAVLLAGCHLVPDGTPPLDFGKVYVNTPATGTVRFRNTHRTKGADVAGYSADAPFAVTAGTPGMIASGASGAPVTVTFLPTAAGVFNGEVRPGLVNAMEVQVTAYDLRGEGVYAKNEGTFSLENRPLTSAGSFTFGSAPIQPGRPIDWGTKRLGGPATEAHFRVRNAGTHVNQATMRMRRGDQHFSVVSPNSPFDVFPNTTRNITVQFTPAALGEFWDIVEVWDATAPQNRAGIYLKAKVTETGE